MTDQHNNRKISATQNLRPIDARTLNAVWYGRFFNPLELVGYPTQTPTVVSFNELRHLIPPRYRLSSVEAPTRPPSLPTTSRHSPSCVQRFHARVVIALVKPVLDHHQSCSLPSRKVRVFGPRFCVEGETLNGCKHYTTVGICRMPYWL